MLLLDRPAHRISGSLFIDEINRGNVAKVFGELIKLVEVYKRIRTDASGNRLAS